jgi:transposase
VDGETLINGRRYFKLVTSTDVDTSAPPEAGKRLEGVRYYRVAADGIYFRPGDNDPDKPDILELPLPVPLGVGWLSGTNDARAERVGTISAGGREYRDCLKVSFNFSGGTRSSEGSVPRDYWPQTSLISSPSLTGVEAVTTLEGAVDTEAFNAYVEHILRPTIKRGDVLVLDNLTAHHASRIEEVAAECGAEVIWLSPYSPDFSPIELMWSKIKAALRAAEARTREESERAFKAALELITESGCLGWFSHCGYRVTSNCN